MSGYVLGLGAFQLLHPIINISLSQGKGNVSSFSLLTNSNYVCFNSISKQLLLSLWSSTTITTTSSSCTPKLKTQATKSQAGSSSSWPQQQDQKQEEEDFQVVTAIRSQFNDISILDTPNSRMLLLDATHNVHSILYKDQKWTGSYWVQTWLELNDRLMPNGRLMVNCGGIDEAADVIDGVVHPKNSSIDGTWVQNYTIKALSKAFPGKLSWKRMPKREGENYLALTGPLPDLISWSAIVPDPLRTAVKQWKPCGTFS